MERYAVDAARVVDGEIEWTHRTFVESREAADELADELNFVLDAHGVNRDDLRFVAFTVYGYREGES